jgi:hypothetical protein
MLLDKSHMGKRPNKRKKEKKNLTLDNENKANISIPHLIFSWQEQCSMYDWHKEITRV